MVDDDELQSLLKGHAAHDDLVRAGFVREVAPDQFQVVHPPAVLEAIRTGQLKGDHARLAAALVLRCTPPKGFWYATTPEELIERLAEDQPL